MTPVIGIAGWKNSGKTTLAVKLIGELTRRGYRVASVKHAHHEADIDHENTDTYRHRAAGAAEVVLVTGVRWAIIHELREEAEPTLADILAKLAPADIVVVEGFKREAIPKIEVRRQAAAQRGPMAPDDPQIVAVATDSTDGSADIPLFDLDDVAVIADFVVDRLGLQRSR
jgi:molybdopterin-guanine dinucleotide biosynthesis protein B